MDGLGFGALFRMNDGMQGSYLLILSACSKNSISTSSLAFFVGALILLERIELAEDHENPVLHVFFEVLER